MSPLARKILNEAVLKAMNVCLEDLPADAVGRREARRLVVQYVHDFAHAHGVILADEDIFDATPLGHTLVTMTAEDISRGAAGDHLPTLERDHRMSESKDFITGMRDVENRNAPGGDPSEQIVHDEAFGGRIKGGEWFVE